MRRPSSPLGKFASDTAPAPAPKLARCNQTGQRLALVESYRSATSVF
jgi:hypothetical protein